MCWLLRGVSVPMASAILMLLYRRRLIRPLECERPNPEGVSEKWSRMTDSASRLVKSCLAANARIGWSIWSKVGTGMAGSMRAGANLRNADVFAT